MKPKRPDVDWARVEQEYRAGQLSNIALAASYGVCESAIRKRATVHGWTKSLVARVKKAVETELVRAEVRAEVRTRHENAVRTAVADRIESDEAAVAMAAARGVLIVQSHRAVIARTRALAETLLEQLSVVAENRERFEDVIAEECAEDRTIDRRNQMMRAVSLPAHASTLKDLSMAVKNLIPFERQAFNLDAEQPDPEESGKTLADAMLARLQERMRARIAGRG